MIKAANRPRVVFDCNVLLQAAASDNGPSAKALRLLEEGRIDVYLSRAVLKELRNVMQYPSVRAKLPSLNDKLIEQFINRLLFRGVLVHKVPHVFDLPRAKQDEPYIDLASAAKADYLVSRDNDLLFLATDHSLIAKQFRRRFHSLHVLNPVAFLAALETPRSA